MKKDLEFSFSTVGVSAALSLLGKNKRFLFAARYNHAVDFDVAFSKLRLRSKDGKKYRLRRVKRSKSDKLFKRYLERPDHKQVDYKNIILVENIDPLPPGTHFELSSLSVPSPEGPLKGIFEIKPVSFKTQSNFQVESIECERNCEKGESITIEFTGTLHPKAKKTWLKVSPPIDGMDIRFDRSYATISGDTKDNTTYTIALSKSFRDENNQPVRGKRKFKQKINRRAVFVPNASAFQLLEPDQPREVSIFTKFVKAFDIAVYKVQPQDWFEYIDVLDEPKQTKSIPGERIYKKTIRVNTDEIKKSTLDLKPFFERDLGNIIVVFTSKSAQGLVKQKRFMSWMQSTKIGLDVRYQKRKLFVRSTDLISGTPKPNVALRILNTDKAQMTDHDGLGSFHFKKKPKIENNILLAEHENDSAFLPTPFTKSFDFKSEIKKYAWYTIGDHRPYLLDEEVHLKGWVRNNDWKNGVPKMQSLSFSVYATVDDSKGYATVDGIRQGPSGTLVLKKGGSRKRTQC